MIILENEKYEILNTTICDCGYEFQARDMIRLENLNQPGVYGNHVKHYGHAKCKQCGKEVVLLLEQVGQTYQVIDIATKVETPVSANKRTIDEKTEASNNLICPVCKKECKSQLGLNNHIKTHQPS